MKTTIKIIAIESSENLSGLTLQRLTPEIECIAHYTYNEILFKALPARRPDILLLNWDLSSLGASGIVRRLKACLPATPVLLATQLDGDQLLIEAIEAGVAGFLGGPFSAADLDVFLKAVHAGRNPLHTQYARLLYTQARDRETSALMRLSPREREILRHLAGGLSAKEVAARLNLSVPTVNTHKQNILHKLAARNITEAVARCAGFTR